MDAPKSLSDLQDYIKESIGSFWDSDDSIRESVLTTRPPWVIAKYFEENAPDRMGLLGYMCVRSGLILWDFFVSNFSGFCDLYGREECRHSLLGMKQVFDRLGPLVLSNKAQDMKGLVARVLPNTIGFDALATYLSGIFVNFATFLEQGEFRCLVYCIDSVEGSYGLSSFSKLFKTWFADECVPAAFEGRLFDADRFKEAVFYRFPDFNREFRWSF